jgi:probable phosphoglycerate mutase
MHSIFLIRHATPDWSRTELAYDVPPGPPLIPQGEAEARHLGEFLAALNIRKVLVSPLERTLKTAELAFAGQEMPLVVEEEIAEWQRGEGEHDVAARMIRVFDRVASSFGSSIGGSASGSDSAALVTHGGPIRLLLDHLGLEKDALEFYRKQFDRDNPTPPAGVWRASRQGDEERWRLDLIYTPQPHRSYVPPTIYV